MRRLTPDERNRAGQITEARIHSSGLTAGDVARMAGVDERTVYALLSGKRWPSRDNRSRIEEALGWPVGELWRQAVDGIEALGCFTDREMLHELLERARRRGDPDAAALEEMLDRARARDPRNVQSPRC